MHSHRNIQSLRPLTFTKGTGSHTGDMQSKQAGREQAGTPGRAGAQMKDRHRQNIRDTET